MRISFCSAVLLLLLPSSSLVAGDVVDAESSVVGLWESEALSAGGIGRSLFFDAEGLFAQAVTARADFLEEMEYGREGSTVTLGTEAEGEISADGRSLLLRKLQGQETAGAGMRRIGPLVPGVSPLVGTWFYRALNASFFWRFTQDGRSRLRVVMKTEYGRYSFVENSLLLKLFGLSEIKWEFQVASDVLFLTREGKEPQRYMRVGSDPWYLPRAKTQPKLLIDASHDGGAWWFPQSPERGFSTEEPHQGSKLTDLLRRRGFDVYELHGGAAVTAELLKAHRFVIRACGYSRYSETELLAYEAFLQENGSLIILADYGAEKDQLAVKLGIPLVGFANGTVQRYAEHPVTKEVQEFSFIAGSAIINPSAHPQVEILGWLSQDDFMDLNRNSVREAHEPVGVAVMGVLHHPDSDVFFIGDTNGIQQVPQPLTDNLISWAFEDVY